jgi:hypothetical protein
MVEPLLSMGADSTVYGTYMHGRRKVSPRLERRSGPSQLPAGLGRAVRGEAVKMRASVHACVQRRSKTPDRRRRRSNLPIAQLSERQKRRSPELGLPGGRAGLACVFLVRSSRRKRIWSPAGYRGPNPLMREGRPSQGSA